MLQNCSECSRLIFQVRYQPHSTAKWAGKIMTFPTVTLERSWISKLWNNEQSMDYLEKLTVSFTLSRVKPSFVKGKSNNKNTQYLIKEPYSHYTVTWQRATVLFKKLTSDSPSPDTAKRKDNKFKKCLYTLTYLNVQDDKTQYKDLLIPENTEVIKASQGSY